MTTVFKVGEYCKAAVCNFFGFKIYKKIAIQKKNEYIVNPFSKTFFFLSLFILNHYTTLIISVY